MMPRKIKKILKSRPTIEGAGVHLKRAFGYSQVPEFDPFLMLDDFLPATPMNTWPVFPGTRIGASRRSPTCWKGWSSMATAWATGVPSAPAMCNG